MMYESEIIASELGEAIRAGKGCIIFDLGCYFPYADDLQFSFSLGCEEMENIRLNHRYPNKGYWTITKKYGRKLSKLGYPYYTDLGEFMALLHITVKVHDDELSMIFPIRTVLTKEKPICKLMGRLSLDNAKIILENRYKRENGIVWDRKIWSFDKTENLSDILDDNETELVVGEIMDNNTIIFANLIELEPQAVKNITA